MEIKNKTQNKIVQTYALDMAEILENDKGGLIKKIIHGEEEHEAERKNLSPESKRNKFFMLISILFLFLGAGIVLSFFYNQNSNTISVEKQFVPLIFNDKSIFVEVAGFSKDKIAETILNRVENTEVKKGGVEGLYLTLEKNISGLREFLVLIKSSFLPGELNLVSDNFLLGVVNTESKDFFILFKVRSLSDVFESMRVWEKKMFLDLHGFFGINISPETSYLLTKDFVNGVIQNKNARILYDKEENIVMMYIQADDNSIIISDTENATREIILRLASSKVKK